MRPGEPPGAEAATADAIETKLAAARTRLILDKPFLGALVLRLPVKAGDPGWCRTTATDARAFYYNRDYIARLDLSQTEFALAHEALHCALSHFARRAHRNRRRWDSACDYAINPLLIQDGLTPPPGALVAQRFFGMTAEEIYPLLDENSDESPHDQHLYDDDHDGGTDGEAAARPQRGQGDAHGHRPESPRGGDPHGNGEASPEKSLGDIKEGAAGGAPRPAPLGESEREQLHSQWQQRLAGAAQQAMKAGRMPAGLARLVDHLLQPALPWRMLLARYLAARAREDYSFLRPSRREGEAILPSARSEQLSLLVAVDTSGSVSDREIREFASEINAIKAQLRARITLHACDAALAPEGPWIYEPWEEIALPAKISGGGGTRFTPVFDWVAGLDQPPDVVVYFTDAEGEFPEREPSCPVIWLVKGRAPVPWGQRIQLN